MTETDPPEPSEHPADEGIPAYADDTSTAYDEADRPRFEDSPLALPGDEPQAIDEFGVTAAESRQGEPLADRLAREEPDIEPADAAPSPEPSFGEEADSEAAARQVRRDAEVLGALPEAEPIESPDDPVSAYDLPEPGEPAGRLVEPDEGVRSDREQDAVATETGEQGGLSAEEAAMYEVPEDEL